MKKALVLAIVTGFALTTGAFAQGTAVGTKNDAKNNNPAANAQPQPAQDSKSMKPATTGAASGASTTNSDPRDSNKPAMSKDKSNLEDAKQKP